jgi:hypothetical protein
VKAVAKLRRLKFCITSTAPVRSSGAPSVHVQASRSSHTSRTIVAYESTESN